MKIKSGVQADAGVKAGKRYRAPALLKGLEILELLASQSEPLTLSGISEQLGRSASEIFRMIQELEATGYIRRNPQGDGYEVTNKLFLLGLEQPRNRSLLEVALPRMRQFSKATFQSCHLAIAADQLIVIAARIEAPGPVSFAVRLGHRQLISRSTSGVVLFAWQDAAEQQSWIDLLKLHDTDFSEANFRRLAESCHRQGYVKKNSPFILGVTDVAAPILKDGRAVASLTAPCVTRLDQDHPQPEIPVDALLNAARDISSFLPPE